MRVTVELHGTDPRNVVRARLLTADGGEHELHDALPGPIPAGAAQLTLGFAVKRTAAPLALALGGRSLTLDGEPLAAAAERLAKDHVQLAVLRCMSQQLRATQDRLAEIRAGAALMTTERDHARRAAVRAEAAAYDATARSDRVAPAAPLRMQPVRRASPRTAVAVCALSSTAVALALLGWPTRDGAREPGGAAVAAASSADRRPAANAAATRGAAAGVLARQLQIPAGYLELYRSAGTRYGLDWTRLAAIGAIESTHGRARAAGVTSGSNARGARGPAQFLAGTWERFGLDGDADGSRDAHDPADAIPAMASYLRASGAPQDWAAALRSYNHSDAYVEAVEQLAASYRRDVARQTAARR